MTGTDTAITISSPMSSEASGTRSRRLLPELYRHASQWYEKNGLISKSIQRRSRQATRTGSHLLEDHGCFLLMSGEVATL